MPDDEHDIHDRLTKEQIARLHFNAGRARELLKNLLRTKKEYCDHVHRTFDYGDNDESEKVTSVFTVAPNPVGSTHVPDSVTIQAMVSVGDETVSCWQCDLLVEE